LNWQHVATGYTETHESRISADNNSIKLSSYVGADLGSVKIASSTENLVISTADNTITIGMEWGTF
jgi:hypothetical protein